MAGICVCGMEDNDKMSDMFCFQCQQTAGNQGCIKTGVCGKQPSTANLQDELIAELIRLAQTAITGRCRMRQMIYLWMGFLQP